MDSGKALCITFFTSLLSIILLISITCRPVESKDMWNGSYIERYEDERFIVLRHNIKRENSRTVTDIVSITIDKETGVQYMDGKPLIDSEGNLLLYEEGE